jgi:hypothetical protein
MGLLRLSWSLDIRKIVHDGFPNRSEAPSSSRRRHHIRMRGGLTLGKLTCNTTPSSPPTRIMSPIQTFRSFIPPFTTRFSPNPPISNASSASGCSAFCHPVSWRLPRILSASPEAEDSSSKKMRMPAPNKPQAPSPDLSHDKQHIIME